MDRIFAVFIAVVVGGIYMALPLQALAAEKHVIAPGVLNWSPLLPGIELAVLEGDPHHEGMFTIRMRARKGGRVAPHWHSKDIAITVLKGAINIGTGESINSRTTTKLAGGAFVSVPKDTRHFVIFQPETVVQICGEGPFAITVAGQDITLKGNRRAP